MQLHTGCLPQPMHHLPHSELTMNTHRYTQRNFQHPLTCRYNNAHSSNSKRTTTRFNPPILGAPAKSRTPDRPTMTQHGHPARQTTPSEKAATSTGPTRSLPGFLNRDSASRTYFGSRMCSIAHEQIFCTKPVHEREESVGCGGVMLYGGV